MRKLNGQSFVIPIRAARRHGVQRGLRLRRGVTPVLLGAEDTRAYVLSIGSGKAGAAPSGRGARRPRSNFADFERSQLEKIMFFAFRQLIASPTVYW
jgi:hypothetical protein